MAEEAAEEFVTVRERYASVPFSFVGALLSCIIIVEILELGPFVPNVLLILCIFPVSAVMVSVIVVVDAVAVVSSLKAQVNGIV